MDTVTVSGKTYVKAAKAAAAAGYTADYVGQLCRAGKLDAVTIGKAWYVREGAVLEHKRSRSRGNMGATRRDLERRVRTELEKQATAAKGFTPVAATPYRTQSAPVRYSVEDADLLPSVSRPGSAVAVSEASVAAADERAAEADEQPEAPEVETSAPRAPYIAPTHEPVSSVDETDDERNVPIRRAKRVVRPEAPRIRGGASAPDIRSRAAEASLRTAPHAAAGHHHAAVAAMLSSARRTEEPRALVVRSPKLPMVLAGLCAVLIFGSIFLEGTWTYTNDGARAGNVQTTYNVASVQSVLELLRGR